MFVISEDPKDEEVVKSLTPANNGYNAPVSWPQSLPVAPVLGGGVKDNNVSAPAPVAPGFGNVALGKMATTVDSLGMLNPIAAALSPIGALVSHAIDNAHVSSVESITNPTQANGTRTRAGGWGRGGQGHNGFSNKAMDTAAKQADRSAFGGADGNNNNDGPAGGGRSGPSKSSRSHGPRGRGSRGGKGSNY
jgi:hypothetical protein